MRDPQGAIEFTEGAVLRRLHRPVGRHDFLLSDLSGRWTADRRLIPFEILDASTIRSDRIPFVTQPDEWCDAQLHAAGQLTLELQQEAVAHGFDLKDASAWNVIFEGTVPRFCDLLSPQPLMLKKWWAAGQYARHFLLPLLLAKRKGLHSYQSFRVWRDGVPPESARHLLGPGRFLSRYWPLMAEGADGLGRESQRPADATPPEIIADFRRGLHASLSWMLKGTRPQPPSRRSPKGWGDYVRNRGHYSESELALKRSRLNHWIELAKPSTVLDLGCNSGEFSRIASETAQRVVCVDGDHAAIQQVFEDNRGSSVIHPVVATLDDVVGGRGWGGQEHPGLGERLKHSADLILMLALIHHLCVAAAIPLPEVARLAAQWTRQWLVVELVGPDDRQMQLLCRQHQRDSAEFSLDRQREAFVNAGFQAQDEQVLDTGHRVLLLMRLATR